MTQTKEKNGIFITFEGIDGSGKSTQAAKFSDALINSGIESVVVRDPGGPRVSESIRKVLLDAANSGMSSITELLLYEAARAQLVEETIKPALADGRFVICDRFYDSTTAYQGYARQLDLDIVEHANQIGSCGLVPDYTFYIDMKPDKALDRLTRSKTKQDRMEAEGIRFQTRVRLGYLDIAKQYPDRFMVVNGDNSVETVHKEIINAWKYVYEDKKR
ncbi:MAG: dTMP kinase [candidate division KSB1 bacterium]|nr:dTMP kinase [candidate division KSB1 bacterium]